MKKLLAIVLVALLSIAAFAAVNFSGSLSVTTSLNYDANAGTLSWSVLPSASFNASASGSDATTGFSVWFGPAFSVNSGYVWWKPYVSDPLTVEFRAGRLSRSVSIFDQLILNGVTANSLAVGFAMKAADLSNSLWIFVDPASAPNYVELDVRNALTFGAIKVETLINNVVANMQVPQTELGLTVSVDAAKLLNIQAASLTVGGGFSGVFPGSPLQVWVVGANFGYDKYSGGVSFNNSNILSAKISTTIFAPVTVGGSFSADVTNILNTMSVGAWAEWKVGVLTNTLSLSYSNPNVTVSLATTASF